jgi:hypothetical protein
MSRLAEIEDEKRRVATDINVECGVLQRCVLDDTVFENDPTQQEAAYRAASRRYAQGEYRDLYSSQREFTDYLKQSYHDHCADECPVCAHRAAS